VSAQQRSLNGQKNRAFSSTGNKKRGTGNAGCVPALAPGRVDLSSGMEKRTARERKKGNRGEKRDARRGGFNGRVILPARCHHATCVRVWGKKKRLEGSAKGVTALTLNYAIATEGNSAGKRQNSKKTGCPASSVSLVRYHTGGLSEDWALFHWGRGGGGKQAIKGYYIA